MSLSTAGNAHREPVWMRVAFVLMFLAGVRPPRSDAFHDLEVGPSVALPRTRGAPRRWPVLLVRLAAQDWLIIAYLLVLLVRVMTGHGPRRATALACVTLDLAVWLGVLTATRSSLLEEHPRVASALYRAGIGFPILASFLQLQWILPAAGHDAMDASLYAFDLRVFGFEPALSWDRFVSPATTEWFAFFYYGYFVLIALHVVPMLAMVRGSRHLARFSFGFVWLYCVGHALYTFVPAYGPYAFLAHGFQHSLEGSFWWPLVRRAVESVDGGARTDVFPSLHTALPTYLALFAFQERRRMPFKLTWLPLGLFTTQIIGATMFLRWHYLVDICAGVALAASGMLMARAALRWDALREAQGGRPVWPRARGAASDADDEVALLPTTSRRSPR